MYTQESQTHAGRSIFSTESRTVGKTAPRRAVLFNKNNPRLRTALETEVQNVCKTQ